MQTQPGRAAPLLGAALCAALLFFAPATLRAQPSAGGASGLALSAMALVGVPYRHGGDDPASGLDCSGLVRFAASVALGIQLPRRAQEMGRTGIRVDEDRLQSGDLVFFNTLGRPYSHVGVYLGNGQFVHAPARRGEVRIDHMAQPYWRARFNGARRLDMVVGVDSAFAPVTVPDRRPPELDLEGLGLTGP